MCGGLDRHSVAREQAANGRDPGRKELLRLGLSPEFDRAALGGNHPQHLPFWHFARDRDRSKGLSGEVMSLFCAIINHQVSSTHMNQCTMRVSAWRTPQNDT